MISKGIPIIWLVDRANGRVFPIPQEQYETISAREADKHLVSRTYAGACKLGDQVRTKMETWAATAN